MMTDILLGAILAFTLLFGVNILMSVLNMQQDIARVESMLRAVMDEMDLLEDWHDSQARREEKKALDRIAKQRATGY